MSNVNNLKEGTIVAMGNPLLDNSARVDDAFLKKWGLHANQATLADQEKQLALLKDMKDRFGEIKYIPGGAVQNSCRVTQWFLGKPNVSVFLGCVGDDEDGKKMAKIAKDAGVKTLYEVTNKDTTGTCAVCITGLDRWVCLNIVFELKTNFKWFISNRSLCTYLGAAQLFSQQHLENNWKYVEEASLFYVSGFFLSSSPESARLVAGHAASYPAKTFTFNTSATFILGHETGKHVLKLLPQTDILFGNNDEAEALAKLLGLKELDVREIAVKVCGHLNQSKECLVVMTQGPDKVITATAKGGGPVEVKEFPVTKLEQTEIADSNGAGDAFVGGFLAQFIQKRDLATCVKSGVYAATEVLKNSGCTFPKENHFIP